MDSVCTSFSVDEICQLAIVGTLCILMLSVTYIGYSDWTKPFNKTPNEATNDLLKKKRKKKK